MNRILITLAIAIASLLTGCTPNRHFVTAVDTQAGIILPQYKAYVAADHSLDSTSKRIRLANAEAFERLIKTAKEE